MTDLLLITGALARLALVAVGLGIGLRLIIHGRL